MISTLVLASLLALPDRAVFVDDDRVDAYEAPSELARRVIEGTAVMFYGGSLTAAADGGATVEGSTYGERFGLCPDARFAEQPAPGLCSGFLVAPDLVVTAGHCMAHPFDCTNNVWAFGFRMDSASDARTRFEPDDLYHCKAVVNQVSDSDTRRDFAVVRLDRPVVGRNPLKLRGSDPATLGEPLALAGYPGGLPVKWVGVGAWTGSTHPRTFLASLDAFGGNSGSPVVRLSTGEVEGILIAGAGHDDYAPDSAGGCSRPIVYPDEPGRGVEVEKISNLWER
ncbi:MAG TPA: serine protease [Bdellovibrionota bacterium]|jgi:V8-like Glu-specific endopeptidase|nr:serine protease [Bdellovibrionota bacterium]